MSFDKNIVFDTGILVSACLYPGRLPAKVYRLAAQRYRLCASSATKDEIATVLKRKKFDQWQTPALRHEWLNNYFAIVKEVEVTTAIEASNDSKDNKFLEVAYAADAIAVVASDPHLTDLHPLTIYGKKIEILGLGEFATRFL